MMKSQMNMSMSGGGSPQHPMPPMSPKEMGKPMTPPLNWIPYYEAGNFKTGEGGAFEETFGIPEELTGAYRISIVMRTDHDFPYFSYNWFYNNDADVCEEELPE
jgi:hypothetical protein